MNGVSPAHSERLLRLLTEQSGDHAFLFLDSQGQVTWWSTGAATIFGYAAGEIVGRHASILFSPADIAAGMPEYEMKAAMSAGIGEDDRWMARKDGSLFWASGILVPVRDEAGTLLAFGKILRNRTDLKEQVETLRNLAKELDSAGRRKDTFLATLAHELRNPLAPIATAVGIIRASSVQPGHEVTFALKVIERQMHLLERLLEDLSDITRVSSGKVELRIKDVVVQEVVAEAAESVGELVRSRGHRLDVVASDAPIVVRGDHSRLLQVVVNLAVNAAKYTPEGGQLWIKATTEGEEAVIKVEDDGMGIAADMLPRIFELFTQVESARFASQGGLGIGLALVKDLVSLHGGTVQVRSDGPGKGSEFAVRLPVARVAGE